MEFAYPSRPYSDFYIAAGFLDPNYIIGGRLRHHKGIDLNLKTGGDSDLGYPLQSMFPGTVVCAEPIRSWGGIVMVRTSRWAQKIVEEHIETTVEVFDVQYAHLMQITVSEGDLVNSGDHIGSIGKGGNNQYLAHLHLEMRVTALNASEGQGSDDEAKQHVERHYLDPEKVMNIIPFSDYGNIMPQRNLEARVRGVSIEGDYSDGSKEIVTNIVGDKFYYRSRRLDGGGIS